MDWGQLELHADVIILVETSFKYFPNGADLLQTAGLSVLIEDLRNPRSRKVPVQRQNHCAGQSVGYFFNFELWTVKLTDRRLLKIAGNEVNTRRRLRVTAASSAVKGMKRLRNSSGKLVLQEKEMAKIAREHFKRNAQGTAGFHSEENGQPEFERQRVKLEVEEIEKLEEPFSSLEVVRALKRMKRGKGVGIKLVQRCY